MLGEILVIKIGLVENVTFADGSTLESAIRKQPVEQVKIHELGAEGNDVGLKKHHGGVDKSLFFMVEKSFKKLTALLGKEFDFHGTAIYGENFVVSHFDESNVCVGDHFQIGDVIVEVSQPRKPCDRLAQNAENKDTHHIVRETGLSGWYVRVVQTGTIKKGDKITRLKQPFPHLTIQHLNRLLLNGSKAELEQALECEPLAEAFKRSLRTVLNRI